MRRWVALAPLLVLAACAGGQHVTLLPGEPGHDVGAVAVLNEDGSERGVIDAADRQANLGGRGTVRPRAVAEQKVAARYGTLVNDLPPPPMSFTLQFDIGDSQPSADQEATLQALFKAAAERPGADVQVVGHTDRVDTGDVNDRLSRRRAEEVRDYLVKRGLSPDLVRATWRGEREPLVTTADGMASAANRRVEVIIR